MNQSKTKSDANPGSAKPPSLARAVSLHMEGKPKEAVEEINRIIEAGEETPELFSAKAQIQFELESYDDASKSYAKVLSVNPQHAAANFNMAICNDRLGRWQEAAEFFEKAVQADPGRTDARLGLGISLLHLDKAPAARSEEHTSELQSLRHLV